MQNTTHGALHEQPAAEVIRAWADSALRFMRLHTTRPGDTILRQPPTIVLRVIHAQGQPAAAGEAASEISREGAKSGVGEYYTIYAHQFGCSGRASWRMLNA